MKGTRRNSFVVMLFCSALLCLSSSLAFAQAPPFPQCPHVGSANSCGVLIVINANNTVSVYADSSIPPYENSEGTLTGVLNNSSKTIASLPLKSTTNIFGFDGDGLCDSSIAPHPAGCPFGSTGYEGPGVAFSNISSDSTSGTVSFNPGIPPGGSAYFGLEEALTAAQVTVPLNTTCPASTATVGVSYSSQLVGTGGNGTYTRSLAGGSLSPLALSSAGLVSGTPDVAGTLNFTLRITDGAAATATQQCSISVSSPQSGGSVPSLVLPSLLTKAVPGQTCQLTPPQASASFLSTDPVIQIWFELSGVNNGDTGLISWTDPSGTVRPDLNISYDPLTGISPGTNYVFCAYIVPDASMQSGQWTVNVYWNNHTPALISLPFTFTNVSGGGGGSGPTCSAASNCTVQGLANIFGSGHPADPTPAPAGGGGGTVAPVFTFTAGAGQAITFTSITGAVSPCGTCSPPLDGGSGGANISGYKGITGYKGAKQFPLVGVFLDNTEPAEPAPATLDFNTIGSTFTTLSPALRQVFYIGDGKTNGAPRQYVVPATATRMYLGFADGFGFTGNPGSYIDNTGSLTVIFALGAASNGGGGGGTCGPTANNLIGNGSFELPGGGTAFNVTATSIPCWTITSGNVDYISSGFWQASDGSFSLDMDGGTPGTIVQNFATTSGTAYTVSFDLAGNPSGAQPKQLQVSAAGRNQNYSFNSGATSAANMGWARGQIFTFTANSSTTTLQFASLSASGSAMGAALDNVCVSAGTTPCSSSGGGGGSVTVACPSASNLIQNCGAEAGPAGGFTGQPSIPGWTTDGNVAVVAYTDSGGDLTPTTPGPTNPGNNYFAGGTVASSQMTQTIDLSASASAIDAGTQAYTLDGWLGGWDGQDDYAVVTATFQNASGATLGTTAQIASPDSSARNGTSELVEVTKTGTVPSGTRKALITVLFTRVSGADNDALADNFFFGLGGSGGGTGGGGTGGGGGTPPTLTGSNCSPSVSPHDINDTSGVGISPPQNGFIFVGPNCQWSAYSPVSWATVTPNYPNTQSGNGAWTYALQPNNAPGATPRSTTLTVASIQVTVEQVAASAGSCTFSLDSTSNTSNNASPSPYTGASGSFNVTVTGNSLCSLTVTMPTDPAKKWVQLSSSNFSGNGKFTVNYTVAQNNTTSARNLSLTIAGYTQSNPSSTATYTVYQAAGPANTAAVPVITGISNAASYIPSSLGAGAIAQGSFFSIFGTDLGPPNPGVTAQSFPFATTLAGVSVTVTGGGRSVPAIPQFVAQFQINAIMPSNAPTGTVQVTVTFNGLSSAPSTTAVAVNNFGVFAVAGGRGPAIVQNFVLATRQTPLNTASVSAAPGDTVILWGTGLGPLPNGAADNQPYPPPGQSAQSLPVSVQVFVGTVVVQPSYSGRAPQFPGVDQINFVVPPNTPQGCYVPVQVVVAGANYSNVVTMAINSNRGPCLDSNPLSALSRAGGRNGAVSLLRINLTDATTPSNNGLADLGLAVFQQDSAAGALGFDLFAALPPLNACTYYNNLNFLNGLMGGQVPSRGSTSLNAGSAITATGPNGSRPLPYADSSTPTSPYLGLLGAGGGFSAYISSQPFLSPGSYTISGPGGTDVGPFSLNLNLPASITTNLSQITLIDRTKGLTINWTGGDPANQAILILGASNDVFTNVSGAFACLAPLSSSSFTVPPGMMANLPSTAGALPDEVQSSLIFLAVPLGNKIVQFNTSAPPSLDNGLAFYLIGDMRNNVTFK